PAGGGQWPALVEKLRDAHQRGLSHPLLRRAGGPPARRVTSTLRTARCGPACRVVWQGSRGITSGPYADWVRLHCGDVKRGDYLGFREFSGRAGGSSVEWHEALPACLTWRALGESSPEESV